MKISAVSNVAINIIELKDIVLQDCDLLIAAGNCLGKNPSKFVEWFDNQDCKHKVLMIGYEDNINDARNIVNGNDIIFSIKDELIDIGGINFQFINGNGRKRKDYNDRNNSADVAVFHPDFDEYSAYGMQMQDYMRDTPYFIYTENNNAQVVDTGDNGWFYNCSISYYCDVVEVVSATIDDPLINFGKYNGKRYSHVLKEDERYLRWVCYNTDVNVPPRIKKALGVTG